MAEQLHIPGQGVPRAEYPSPPDVDPAEAVPVPETDLDEDAEKDEKGNVVWSNKPTFSDQLARFPLQCRHEGPTIETFDLSVPDDLKRLNALYARQLPITAPGVRLDPGLCDRQFTGKNWMVLVGYYTMQYKRLLIVK